MRFSALLRNEIHSSVLNMGILKFSLQQLHTMSLGLTNSTASHSKRYN